jgi:L-lactate dehydrogenase complex protein LldG
MNLNALYQQFKYGNTYCADNELKEILTLAMIPFSDKEEDFDNMAVSITFCEHLIARFGSIMVSSRQLSGRRAFVYPHVHIVIAYTSQLVLDIKDAFTKIKCRYTKIPLDDINDNRTQQNSRY